VRECRVAVAVALLSLCLWTIPAFASAIPPHVPMSQDTDVCAMCHRGHSASSTITVDPSNVDGQPPMNALIIGSFDGEAGDTELCFSCHNGLGSTSDTLAEFEAGFSHNLAPGASDYGPSPKGCYSCHDSHGSARSAGGAPYAGLLESIDSAGSAQHQGDAYCEACHTTRAGNAFPGEVVWRGTAHASELATTDGSQISCLVCHLPHGSTNSALIVNELVPPAVASTVSVPANDRWLCFNCHPAANATYPGGIAFQSSGHGSSATTVVVDSEWARVVPDESPYASRRVGECQNCHSAMGADDGTGDPIPKLARLDGSPLCFECHGSGSTTATDIESSYTTPGAPIPEVVGAFAGATNLTQYGRAQFYTRESSSSPSLLPPRTMLEKSVGPMTTGDIDGDGTFETLVSRSGSADVSIVRGSSLSGVTSRPGPVTLLAEPSFLVVDDILADVTDYAEVIAADGATLRVYRWNGATLGLVDSITTTYTITGIATGDVAGTTGTDIVATTSGAASSDNRMVVVSGDPGSLTILGSYVVAGDEPRGPSVGDLDGTGKAEVAIAMGADNNDVLQIYSGTGAQLSAAGSTSGGEHAQKTLINNMLWGVQAAGRSVNEVAVIFADPAGAARLDVFPQTAAAPWFGTELSVSLTDASNPSDMATGDVDGDQHVELVVARAGSFSHFVPAGLEVVQANGVGTAISGTTFYQAAGNESADTAPGRAWVSVADIGDVGLSRHAVDSTPNTHVSTETDGFSRHVECVDCHSPHESTSTVAAAPDAFGAIQGAWGVSVANAPVGSYTYTEKHGVDYEYELCMKCHGDWAAAGDTRNIAEEIDTRNASVHAVEAASTSSQVVLGSFVATTTPWTNSSVMYCTSCHGAADAAMQDGPHVSTQAPLLKAPYLGGSTSHGDGLCYTCHRYDVYYTGVADLDASTGSRFWNNNQPSRLHMLHAGTNGLGCQACHTSHGAELPHLIRGDVGYIHSGTGGGSCANQCHGGGTHAYSDR